MTYVYADLCLTLYSKTQNKAFVCLEDAHRKDLLEDLRKKLPNYAIKTFVLDHVNAWQQIPTNDVRKTIPGHIELPDCILLQLHWLVYQWGGREYQKWGMYNCNTCLTYLRTI